MNNRYVVIMAGGRGERFWPQSRLRRPKHLLPIVGEEPMLVQTVNRLSGLVPVENVFVVTNSEQRDAVLETCPNLLPERVVGEPEGRDTAAAVALSALLVQRENPSAAFAMLPADHVIEDTAGFRTILNSAFEAAETQDLLVTIGIRPTEPATGYGYIQRGEPCGQPGGRTLYNAVRFVEKPDRETAEGYVASGDYLWNAGMFVWRPAVILKAISSHAPDLAKGIDELDGAWTEEFSLDEAMQSVYPTFIKISVDFAVMEKAENVAVLESAFDWDDVGEWPAIERHFPADEMGNVFRGAGLALESKGNVAYAEDGHMVALLGVDDLIVVQSPDATLVCRKDMAQGIKELTRKVVEAKDGETLV